MSTSHMSVIICLEALASLLKKKSDAGINEQHQLKLVTGLIGTFDKIIGNPNVKTDELRQDFREIERHMTLPEGAPSFLSEKPADKPLIIWTGVDAMMAAQKDSGVCNTDVPVLTLVYNLWEEYNRISEKNEQNTPSQAAGNYSKRGIPDNAEHVVSVISRVFVESFASKEHGVHIYLSNNKKNEFGADKAVLPSDGVIWRDEIHIARERNFPLHIYNVRGDEVTKLPDMKNVVMVRNNGHDLSENNRGHYSPQMCEEDREKYSKQPQRPYVSYSKLEKMGRDWRDRAQRSTKGQQNALEASNER